MRSAMIKFLKFIILCAVICVAKEAKEVESSFRAARVHVVIANDIGRGIDMTVHCKSGDDDLGIHVLKHGEQYEFSFRPNYLMNTLFFCGCTSVKGHAVFDAYKQWYDQFRCAQNCKWTANEQGVQGGQGLKEFLFVWQKN